MTEFRVLIADGLEENGQSILRAAATVENRDGISAADLLSAVHGSDALIVGGRTKVSPEVFEAGASLKVVGQNGADVDNIDLDAAKKHGAVVVNAPLATTHAVAELVFGLLLALAREIPRADAAMKGERSNEDELQGVELGGKTLGIIGYGPSGVEVGKWAAAVGMNVVAYDPFVQEQDIHSGGAETVSLQDLFAWSDFISLHLPFDVHSRDLIGPLALSQMKDGVRLVCASGSGMIDEQALLSALNSGKVAGAALDVFAAAPTGASLLVRHPHVIATPQIGTHTLEARVRAAEDIAREVLAALRGEPLRWRVV
jgi:D-3-phosphoglycerate dehydrogenase